jgi:peptidoglycan/xylan/chitin deacetylase (PgdA/CDA1 family)
VEGRPLLSRVNGVEGRFALTFDDGPSPTWTPRVLDALAAAGGRATFFPIARNVRRHEAIARRAAAEGHELGVHGEWHLPPPLVPWVVTRREIALGVAAATAVTGRAPALYRPPFGVLRAGQSARVRRMGLLPVLGDVWPRDVERPGVDEIVRRVLAALRPGSIVILHDSSGIGDFDRSQSVEAAARILPAARARGLMAVTVSELLSVPGAAPDVPWAGADSAVGGAARGR